jgi:hypothetical protein
MKPVQLIAFLFLLVSLNTNAQDTLQFRNGDKKTVKIVELGLDELQYAVWGLDQSPIITIEKKDVRRIVFSNGETIEFRDDPMALETIQQQAAGKTRAIKIDFFAPLFNKVVFGYEHMLKPGTNLEYKLGLIGVGTNQEMPKASGAFVKTGIKLWSGKDYYHRGMRMSHPLRGSYVRPELIIGYFRQENEESGYFGPPYTVVTRYTNVAANICFGKQFILGDWMTLDYYVGVGYGWQSGDASKPDPYGNDSNEYESYAYSHLLGSRAFPFALSGGLTLGVLLK